jgi:hypothetical protein
MADLRGNGVEQRAMRLPMLEGYFELVWANIVVIVIATVTGGVLGYLAQRQLPTSYTASVSVELPDVPTWVDLDPADPIPDRTTIDTSSQLVFTPPVFRAVADVTGEPTVRVQRFLSVSAYPLSRVLIVTYEGATPEVASAGALAAGQAVARERETSLAGNQRAAAGLLLRKLGNIYDTRNPFSPVQRNIKAQMVQVQRFLESGGAGGGAVVDTDDPKKVDKHPELQVITGMVLGLIGSIIYAWWRPRRRIPDPRAIGLSDAAAQPRRRSVRRLSPLGARLRLDRLSFRVPWRADARPRR